MDKDLKGVPTTSSKENKGKKVSCPKDMDAQLRAFLEEHRVKSGDPFTHVSKMAKQGTEVLWSAGSYYIGSDDIRKFWTLYCNAITTRIFPTLAERPTPVGKPIGPLRVDFDLKSALTSGAKRQYTQTTIKLIIEMYQQAIKHIINEDVFEDKMLMCIVLEKPKARKENDKTHGVIIKDGFHLHFPHFHCSGWTQDHYLRDLVCSQMQSQKIWAGVDLIEGVAGIIDKQMATKMWMMYGSMNYKNNKSKPYLATKAYDHNCEEITLQQVFEDEMEGRKSVVQYYLPEFLSVKGYDEETALAGQFSIRMPKPRKPVITRTRSEAQVMADLKRIEEGELLDLLSDERISDYHGWMDIGWTLFNIGQGCDEALQMWIDVSMRSSKFLDGACDEEWSKMEMRGKTMGSLIKMVQEDHPAEYKQWQMSQIDYCIKESLRESKATECDIAAVVYRMYEGRFICTRSKKDKWYEFKNHRWFEIDDAHSIKFLLSTEVRDEYERYANRLMDERRETQDETVLKRIEQDLKRCFKISHDLKTVAFHKKITEALKLRMMDDKFEDKLDNDTLLMGCENGIIDLKIGMFRPGRPDDYVSRTTKLFWRDYDNEDREVVDLKKFLKKIFPDPDLFAYFFDFFSSCLEAGNIHKTLLVGTGGGNNGKSKTFKMIEFAFGEYCTKFSPETLVAGRGQVGGTRTDLIRARYSRVALCDEIAAHEKINIGAVKQITGGDSVPCRDLYEGAKEQKDIQAQFTLCIQCNELFKIPGQDDAMWERVRVLNFESEFVKPKDLDKKPVPDDPEEQMKAKKFIADLQLSDNWLRDQAPVLLWILVKNFPKYKSHGIKEPEKVKASTDAYRGQNDVYRQYIKDHLQRIPKDDPTYKTAGVGVAEAFKLFCGWYKNNYPSYAKSSPIDSYNFKSEMTKRMCKAVGVGKMEKWMGWSVIEDNEDPADTPFGSMGK